MIDYKQNWPLPDNFLIELGRLSCLWNALELALNFGIHKLSGFDNIGDPIPFILTTHSSFPQRLDMLGALCELHLPGHPSLKAYKSVISQVKMAQSSRNKFIHNAISFEPTSNKYKIAITSARQSIKASVNDICAEDIHEACKQVHVAHLALHELVTGQKHEPVWDIVIS